MGKPEVSDFRFCRKASEVPVGAIYRASVTIALASFETHVSTKFPSRTAVGYGMVHNNGINYYNKSAAPMLPVQLSVARNPLDDGAFAAARIEHYHHLAVVDTWFKMTLVVGDPSGELTTSLTKAFEHALSSGTDFFHMTFRHAFGSILDSAMAPTMFGEHDKLDAEFANGTFSFPELSFESVDFTDKILLKAPYWATGWAGEDFSDERFGNPMYEKWRRGKLKD